MFTILKAILVIGTLLLFATAISANEQSLKTGAVAETMAVGSYVYARVEDNNLWLAAPFVPVAVGDTIKFAGGAMMKDFYSPVLERTFEDILFVPKLEVIQQVNVEDHANTMAHEPIGITSSEVATVPKAGEIEPLSGGKTIASIYSEQSQLQNQKVAIRARVMKVSLNILGKNWITLQDGSGVAPDDQLIATSSEVVSIGELVTVEAVVRNNVDLGSGYNYRLLLENASFTQ